MLKNLSLWKKRALFSKKLWNVATGNGNGFQKCLKTLVFEKKRALCNKKFEISKVFHPQTGNTRLLLRFYVTIFSNFKQNKPNFFFFRSKNLENLRGFCPPNRKWRLLLRFYVTIFSNFKQNKPKFSFRRKKPREFKRFLPPKPEMKAWT